MAALPPPTVDVQDMLCAQALAVVSAAVARLAVGACLEVHYNTDDVKRDLCVWAAAQGHHVHQVRAQVLSIERQSSTTHPWPTA